MCKAFSCLVDITGKKVTWELGVDSHSELVKLAGYKDNTADRHAMEFAKVEITPRNGNYLFPDEWEYRVDESPVPSWIERGEFKGKHEVACRKAHAKWLRELDKILVRKGIVRPFKIKPPEKITEQHIELLKEWGSVRDSVGDSVRGPVWDSVWGSVGDSVRDSMWGSVGDSVADSMWDSVADSMWDSVGDSVRDSVRDSVGDSVWDSVYAYIGSFFKLPEWKYIKHGKGVYPFQPAVTLWEMGLVPSYDGSKWRLHAGPKAKVVFEISGKELKEWKPGQAQVKK